MPLKVFFLLGSVFMFEGYARQDVPELTYDLSQDLRNGQRFNLAHDTALTMFFVKLQPLPCEEVERLFEQTDRGYIYRLERLLEEIGIQRCFTDKQKRIIREYYKNRKRSIKEIPYNLAAQSLNEQLEKAVKKWLCRSGISFSDLKQKSLTICPIIPFRLNGPCEWWNLTALPQGYVDVLYNWFRVRMMSA